MKYYQVLNLIENHFSNKRITARDKSFFENNLTHYAIKQLLLDIAENQELLEKIAARSYLHALGFYKIVLVDSVKDLNGNKDTKCQLRFHLWQPNVDSVPIVESLHEHSFDFVSTVLCGSLENQSFVKYDALPHELKTLNKVLNKIPSLSKEELEEVDKQIEYLLCHNLQSLGSKQYSEMNYKDVYNPNYLIEKLDLTEEDLKNIVSLQGFYKSDRVSGEKKAYKHILDKYVALKEDNVATIDKGEYYYHNYQYPHRLFYDATDLNATLLITTNVPENQEGGSFQRPTYVQNNEINYEKKSIGANELKDLILSNIKRFG